MPTLTAIYGEEIKRIDAPEGSLLGEIIPATGLPLEQPCAGRGTCGKCKVLVEAGVAPPDEIERMHLTPGELALNNRLACRARLQGETQVLLSPIVVYSNKSFRRSYRYRRTQSPLGLAVDLGSTTVAAFLIELEDGEICAGGASLNQQTVYGADVISRLAAALHSPDNQERLHRLALASINQAVDALKLPAPVRERIQRVTVVGNVAMHHLLARLPITTLAALPFQPFSKTALADATALMGGVFPEHTRVSLPPLIGGFVGSDALACLAYFHFDNPPGPLAAIDLGTNGEVMVTDGRRILTASTAAGPAFEGVNISCGSRAVNGAITAVRLEQGTLQLQTIGAEPPVGLTGSGLLSLVHTLRQAGVVEPSGRIAPQPPVLGDRIQESYHGKRILLGGDARLGLSQWDIRELQKAKGAIRAAFEILMARLGLKTADLQQVILTGSFGSQVDLDAAIQIGLVPAVERERVAAIPNGAGFGAAIFLSDEGFAFSQELAARSEQVELDQEPGFYDHYIDAMALVSVNRHN